MNGTFPGRIVLVEGDEVDVDLQISDEKIRLATPFAEIGLWDRAAIHFERNSSGGYELSVADDVVTFYPADLAAFAEAVEDGPDEPERMTSPMAVVHDEPELDDITIDPHDDAAFGAGHAVSGGEIDAEITPFDEEPAVPDDQNDVSDDQNAEEARVSRFGLSSRERLASAMSTFRDRESADEGQDADEDGSEVASEERRSSSGFVIPGDADYAFPAEEHPPIALEEEIGESTVADEVLASQRMLRNASSVSFDPALLKKIGIGLVAAAVVVGLVLAAPIVLDFFATDEQPAPDTAAQTTMADTAPPTTTADTTPTTVVDPTVAVDPTVFELSSSEFIERWNDTAASVSPNLRFRSSLPAGDFEVGFTQYIAMIGSSLPGTAGGALTSFTIEVDPTGPSSSDQLGIQALGLAIAVADPVLEPGERALLLAEMGLNVRDPQLQGLNGATSRNGIDYRLVFDAEAVMLRLSVSPRG